MAELIPNWRAIEVPIGEAFKDVCDGLDQALTEAITSDVWQYPRLTRRRSGQAAGSPRDIVDLGELKDSQRRSQSEYECQWEWTADHAAYVHEGLTFRNGTVIPPRRWTEYALEQYPVFEEFQKRL